MYYLLEYFSFFQLSEEEAVDILARQFGVLLMYGAPFGAPNFLRLSYANLLPEQVSSAVDKVKQGLEYLQQLSKERCREVLEVTACDVKTLSHL